MARRRATGRRLSLEVGFEPRRGGQDFLADAYYCCVTGFANSLILLPFLAKTLGQDCRVASMS